MSKEINFTEGEITRPLIRFAVPIMLALLLQCFYGAIDTLIVGRFASSADISAVSTATEIMYIIIDIAGGISMGITVLIGQHVGRKERRLCGKIIGNGVSLFLICGAILSIILIAFAAPLARLLSTPDEAFKATVDYLRICGGGSIIVFLYNLLGSILRGFGDSRTPLISVAIAAVCNIIGDLVLVAGFGMGARGAAIATVLAQAVSVIITWAIIKRRELSFDFEASCFKPELKTCRSILNIGIPIALQGVLADISYTIITAIVNSLGVIPSAGVGVASKLCAFIMLVTAAFMQSTTCFVAQNYGANRIDRAKLGLRKSIIISVFVSVIMFIASFFYGDILTSLFTSDTQVIQAAAEYLKAYAIDCLLTCYLYCLMGYFNGLGKTRFVMLQSLAGAFLIRVPVSYFMSQLRPVSLFKLGISIPLATVFQIIIVLSYYIIIDKKHKTAE